MNQTNCSNLRTSLVIHSNFLVILCGCSFTLKVTKLLHITQLKASNSAKAFILIPIFEPCMISLFLIKIYINRPSGSCNLPWLSLRHRMRRCTCVKVTDKAFSQNSFLFESFSQKSSYENL
jgi:hypothetical protein